MTLLMLECGFAIDGDLFALYVLEHVLFLREYYIVREHFGVSIVELQDLRESTLRLISHVESFEELRGIVHYETVLELTH